MMQRKCFHCGELRDESDFYDSGGWCKPCRRAYYKKYAVTHKKDIANYHKQYYQEHKKDLSKSARHNAYLRQRRRTVIEHYGGRCECCGEDRWEFLAIDHANGDGAKHRKEIGGGTSIIHWLIKNNFPAGFRVLCHNCNCAYGFYGYCPHHSK